MRIRNISLKDYKRFTELRITEIPQTSKLVVLVGPNGCGKSSVFDSFLLKSRSAIANYQLSPDLEQYYEKVTQARNLHDVSQRVDIEFHDTHDIDLKVAFQVRSAYRNEADFQIKQLRASTQDQEGPRLTRIIDIDSAVSKNYSQLAGKGLQDLFYSSQGKTTFEDYRRDALGELHDAMRMIFTDPELLLQDFGAMKSGSFRFSKGAASDFHYKNLSGGEKAAFDLLLDVFIRRHEFGDAVYCIDEPELHVATSLQSRLVTALLDLLPDTAQLWIATHSIGIAREAYRMKMEDSDAIAFLDFSNQNFDAPVTIKPCNPNRTFWMNFYKIALDDLSSLVAPQRIIICEGCAEKHVNGFDAKCYIKLFADEFPETLFLSRGGSGEVIQSDHLIEILGAISKGTKVIKLVDRDDMAEDERRQKIDAGVRVLRRRELEEYLYDSEVIRTFLLSKEYSDNIIDQVLIARRELLKNQAGPENIKDVSRGLFEEIRKITRLSNLGSNRSQFAFEYLVPALRNTPDVFNELRQDVFDE
ncbi:MAG: AAA family ATPase [Gammaproteobacteria bacterium]|nr:AAA family ATPase [Gammaproteobacteria bacterium]MCY4228825.1 AAA family ATPase [Gammaproteobacteria bacterium]